MSVMAKFHTAYPESVIKRIGIVAIEGAALDLLLGRLLVKLTKPEIAEELQHEDGFDQSRKEDTLAKLPNLPQSVGKLLEQTKGMRDDRNFAIHGLDAVSFQDGEWVGTSIATRGKYLSSPRKREVEWLDALIERITDASSVVIKEIDHVTPLA